MNGYKQVEIHYINTGFPYTVTESFMDFFEGLSYALGDFSFSDSVQDQVHTYWSPTHASPYKYALSGTTYYSYGQTYYPHDCVQRIDGGRRALDTSYNTEPHNLDLLGGDDFRTSASSGTEERNQGRSGAASPQDVWQHNIDPDNMTYEELLDLGESVGTHNRGLSKEHISLLPVSKYKCRFLPWKKNRRERCVICQMEYKRGDRQMTLPCKHRYHVGCVTRWLGINKVCPVCFSEVSTDETRRQ